MASMGSTKTARARQMRGVVARWERSGLTQREFAARNGLTPTTISWWRHVFRRAAEGQRPSRGDGAAPRWSGSGRRVASLVEVKLAAPANSGGGGLEVVLRTGHLVRVPAHFEPATLRAVVAALEASC
jgi:hypothetical protein